MKPITSATGKLAFGGVMTAVSLALQLLGGAIGIGTYAAPLLGCICTALVLRLAGRRTALLHWLATGLLSLMLCPDHELALLYLCLLGWYPVVKPLLDRIPAKLLRLGCKLVLFNGVILLLYTVSVQILYGGDWNTFAPDGLWIAAACLVLGNIILLLVDFVLDRLVDRFVQKS